MNSLPIDASDPVHRTCPLCGYDYAGHRCDNPGCEASGNVPPEILARRAREESARLERARDARALRSAWKALRRSLHCQGAESCAAPVTMLDRKGYVYCGVHGLERREVHPCRLLRRWELELLRSGKALPSYAPVPRSKALALLKQGALAALLSLLSLPAFAAPPCKVNVNTATPEQLQLFARTGPVLALRLASGRPYRHLEAVDAVKGVGPAWLSVNGPHVAFSGQTTCTEKVASPKVPKVAAQAPKL